MSIILPTLLNNQRSFLMAVSAYYPISKELLARYANVWKWDYVSRNTRMEWDEQVLEQFQDKWQWGKGGIAGNESIPWSCSLLEKFKHKWDWASLGSQPAVINDPDMLKLCLTHWRVNDQGRLFQGLMAAIHPDNRVWAEKLFENWPGLHWQGFSNYRGFPWTTAFIRKHAEKLYFKALSCNKGIPWSIDLIKEYATKWDWIALSNHTSLPWSAELIEAFADKWNWKALCWNEAIKWNTAMLRQFRHQLHWAFPVFSTPCDDFEGMEGLINNPGFTWTPALFEEYRTDIEKYFKKLAEQYKEQLNMEYTYWTYYQNGCNWSVDYLETVINIKEDYWRDVTWGYKFIHWHRVSRKGKGFWNAAVIERYGAELELWELGRNPHFPWNEYIDRFADKPSLWSDLSANPSLRLSDQLVEQYEERWDWRDLSTNPTLTATLIEKYKDKWDWEKLSENPAITEEIVSMQDQWDWWSLVSVKAEPNSYIYFSPFYNYKNPNKQRFQMEHFVSIELLTEFLEHISHT